ncbi:hypothetical protein H5410_015680 [Solanum commersonii]|uniref:Uncharacterized protein n=1 Tax=Solanum commersonii TaxID=4109 RepID=A0A9J5ZUI4_SOLCO|nr:hypothetical protein H5410_015680 [Solanum commersonii]
MVFTHNLLPPSFLLGRQRVPLEGQEFLSVQFCCFWELRTQRLFNPFCNHFEHGYKCSS